MAVDAEARVDPREVPLAHDGGDQIASDEGLEEAASEELGQRGEVLGGRAEGVEAVVVEDAVGGHDVEVDMRVQAVAEPLDVDHDAGDGRGTSEAGAAELVQGASGGT